MGTRSLDLPPWMVGALQATFLCPGLSCSFFPHAIMSCYVDCTMILILFLQILVLLVAFLTLLLLTLRTYMKLTNGVCKSKARLDGKTVMVTGANSGK